MELTVNGEMRQVADGATVSQLLETLQVAPERVVVELNLAILKRAEHADRLLKEGDQIEIVQFVGGGAGRPEAFGHRKAAWPRTS